MHMMEVPSSRTGEERVRVRGLLFSLLILILLTPALSSFGEEREKTPHSSDIHIIPMNF